MNDYFELLRVFKTFIESDSIFENSVEDYVSKLISAINKRYYVGLFYESDKKGEEGFRLCEPLVLGKGFVSPKTGELSHPDDYYLRAFIIKDTEADAVAKSKFKKSKGSRRRSYSFSNSKPHWRLFAIRSIKRLDVFRKKFTKLRPYYNPNDSMMNEILASVPKSDLKESISFYDDYVLQKITELKTI